MGRPAPELPCLAWVPFDFMKPGGERCLKCLLCNKWVQGEKSHTGSFQAPAGSKHHPRKLRNCDVEGTWSKRMKATHYPVYGAEGLQRMWGAAVDAWAGIFATPEDVYYWGAEKVGGDYADPSMAIVLLPAMGAAQKRAQQSWGLELRRAAFVDFATVLRGRGRPFRQFLPSGIQAVACR